MRNVVLFAVAAALTLVGVGGWMEWGASTTQARVETTASIDPMQIMMNAKNLPIEEFVVFP